jgi:hypothetical protein
VTPLAKGALGSLPQGLRAELLQEYAKITRNYRERRWEAAELNGGRFCEIVYTILDGYLNGRYPASASKPKDMKTACDALAQRGKGYGPRLSPDNHPTRASCPVPDREDGHRHGGCSRR